MTKRELLQRWKRWCKEWPNPLDLRTVHQEKFMVYKNYCYQLKAMEEYSPIFKQTLKILGVTIRKFTNEGFKHCDDQEAINYIRPFVEKMEKETGIECLTLPDSKPKQEHKTHGKTHS